MDRGRVDAFPELIAGCRDASLIHEAAIGRIAGEQIVKLRTLGLSEEDIAAIRQAGETLLQYDNVRLYGYLMDADIVTDLDNYCDYIHHSGAVCREILAMLRADEGRLTEENLEETLASWREFVVHYDYDKFWDEDFWTRWNAEHAA